MLSFNSCSTTEEVLKRYQGYVIELGTSGGYSGQVKGFRIESNGIVRSIQGRQDNPLVKMLFSMDRSTTGRFYEELDRMKFNGLSYSGGGSTNYFVDLRRDSVRHRIHWSPGDTLAPIVVREFYERSMLYLKEHNPKRDSAEDAGR